MPSFEQFKKLYDEDKLEEFNSNSYALLWLKIKSIIRRDILDNFLSRFSIKLDGKILTTQFEELYKKLSCNLEQSHKNLDTFFQEGKNSNDINTEDLVSELYKLRSFNWGGDYKNQLDKHLVNKYIKSYSNYDELTAKLDTDIKTAVQGYVLCSWYNHWSSILIENIFKQHPKVLPALGQIKKVDFFINNVPFDLKVTYLPANFIEKCRKEKGLKPELTELKQKAKQAGIKFTVHNRADDIYYEIVEKMKDRNDDFCQNVLSNMKKIRLDILEYVQKNPKVLIKNLYEEQGELRFDASNRLFLILVDTEHFDNSWKLKRNLDLLRPKIETYLNEFDNKQIDDLKISFTYNKTKEFTAIGDIIFVVK